MSISCESRKAEQQPGLPTQNVYNDIDEKHIQQPLANEELQNLVTPSLR